MPNKISVVGLLLSSAASLQPINASAQEGPSETTEVADDGNVIIVTARGREENIQDVPLAITAFDEVAIEKKNVQDLTDVARFTAGFAFENLSGGFAVPTIRGQAALRVTALEQPVATFYNGVYLPRAWLVDIGSNDLARIEVVKGPQSSRYGRNAFAGAINYISPSADLDEVGASVSATYGTDERLDAGGSVSFPIVPGVLAVRAAYDHTEYDGSWENTHPNNGLIAGPSTEGNVGGWNREAYSASILFQPTDGLRLEARYAGFERRDEASPTYWLNSNLGDGNCGTDFDFGGAFPIGAPGGPRLFCGSFGVLDDTVSVEPRAYGRISDSDIYTLKADWEITDAVSFGYLFGRVESSSDGRFTTEADQVNCGGIFNADGNVAFLGTLCNFQGAPTGSIEYDSHEARMTYDDGGPLTFGIGGFYSEGTDNRIAVSVNLLPGDLTGGRTDPVNFSFPDNIIFINEVNDTTNRAIFGEVGYALPNDATRISAELRYTSEKLVNTNLRTTPPSVLEDTFNFLTPRFTIEHDIADGSLLYLTVARGAKAGGFNAGAFSDEQRTFDPEFNWTYEVGTKSSFWDGRAIVNAAAFLTKWDGMQITSADPNNPDPFASTLTLNLGNATVYGVEVEAQVSPTDNLTFDGTLAYTSSTFDDGTIDQQYVAFRSGFPPSCDGVACDPAGDISGNDLPRTPSFMASFGAEWRGEYNNRGDEVFIRSDVSYQDGFFADTVNLSSSPSRFLVNGRAGVSLGNIGLSVWARNLFDKKYVSSSQQIVQSGGANLFGAFYGERRTVGVTASFDY